MPFYGKQTLLRVYRSWNASKRLHTNRYIQVAYGNTFLQALKSTCNKTKEEKSSHQGRPTLTRQKRAASKQEAPRKNPPTDTDEIEGFTGETSSKTGPIEGASWPQSQSQEDTGGTSAGSKDLSQSPREESKVTRRSQRRRIAGDVSSTSGSKEESRAATLNKQGQEGAEMTSHEVADGDHCLSKKVQQRRNPRRRPSKFTPGMTDGGRDGNMEDNLKVSSSQTSQNTLPKEEGSPAGSKAKQDKLTSSSPKCLGGQMTNESHNLSLEQQDLGDAAASVEYIEQGDAAGDEKTRKATTCKTNTSPNKNKNATKQESSARNKRGLKRRNLGEEKSLYTSRACLLEADIEKSTTRNIGKEKRAEPELQKSEVASDCQTNQPLNVEVELLTETNRTSHHQLEGSKTERRVDPPRQSDLTGLSNSEETGCLRKSRMFPTGPRTRLDHQKCLSQRAAIDLRCQGSFGDAEMNQISLNQGSSTSEMNTQKISSSSQCQEDDTCSPQERVDVPHKILRLRQTARKCCPQGSKASSAKQKGHLETHPFTSTLATDQTKGLGSFDRHVSVKALKMEESENSPKMKCAPAMIEPKELEEDDQETEVDDKQASPVQENSDSVQREEVKSDRDGIDRHDPASSEHEEMMVSVDRKKSTKKTVKPTRKSRLKVQGQEVNLDAGHFSVVQMHKEFPRFENPQGEAGFSESQSACEAASSSAVTAESLKLFDSFHENLKWDVGVVACIEDVPLLEDDDGQASPKDEVKTSSSKDTNQGDKSVDSSLCPASQDKLPMVMDADAGCSEDEDDVDVRNDHSVINESVDGGESSPLTDNPLPGLSNLKRNQPMSNPPLGTNVSVSPVFDTISKLTRKQTPVMKKITRKEGKSQENQENRFIAPGGLKDGNLHEMHQESQHGSKLMERSIPKERDESKAIAPTDDRNQPPSNNETMGNAGMASQLPDNCTSGKKDGSLEDANLTSVAMITTDVAMGTSSAVKRSIIGRKIRTAAEKKQGRVRGQSGWEESLRQKPATISKFQAGDTSKPSIQHETVLEKRRWQSPTKATSTWTKPDCVKSQRSEKATTFREVWKPPPAKKLKLSDDCDEPQKLNIKDEQDNQSTSQDPTSRKVPVLQDKFLYGELVWGKMKGFNWWPATVIHHHVCVKDAAPSDACWLQWFGDDKFSKVNLSQVTPFAQFSAHFSPSTFLHTALYRRAVFKALQLAATRASKTFSTDPAEFQSDLPRRSKRADPTWLKFYNLCNEMVSWAKDELEPSGQGAIQPSTEEHQIPPRPKSPSPPASPTMSPPTKRTARSPSKCSSMWKDIRDSVLPEIHNGVKCIEDICIGCGSSNITAEHPFFVGGLCEVCRIELVETTYVFDEDGYQCFCCICGEGKDIILCDQPECYRSFCHDCVDYLIGPGTVERVLATDSWKCYMCHPQPTHGLLTRRADWPHKLLLFFQQDCNQAFPPMQTYPPVEMDRRKPVRVLSLFDGIGTGMLVLKELGVQVDCYYASEISEEAIRVSSVRQDGIIQQLGDVQYITEQEIQSLGPFDLVIGGSPCNDLSIANPARKGLFEGTGRLFFEFYRILAAARPPGDSDRPFFWFFENVVGMRHKDKMDITRFLQCDPVVVDAKDVSPAHRARYFWGNLPGMNRPSIATDHNSLSLQECLEPNCNRQAQFSKVRTVTSKLNSIKQKNEQVLPVLMNGHEDTLWCTEMERIFGFPDHYTDIANMSRTSRHKLIGQAWSVPVIKHLLAPLKEYYACETQQ